MTTQSIVPTEMSVNVSGNFTDEMDFSPTTMLINIICTTVALIICIGNISATVVLNRCTGIPFQPKNISISFILSDAVGALVLVLFQVVIFIFGIQTSLMWNLRSATVGFMHSISWCSVTALSLDRAIALKANLRYAELVTQRTINVTLLCIWLLNLTILPVVTVYGFVSTCSFRIDMHCDVWVATEHVRLLMLSLLVIFGIVVVVSSTYVLQIARRHKRQITNIKCNGKITSPDNLISENQFSVTKAVITIVVTFVILHGPVFTHYILGVFKPDGRDEVPRRMFYFFSYTMVQISSFVNLLLYTGKFVEFKYHLYKLFGQLCGVFARRADDMRVNVYNIVVSEESYNKNA